MTMLADIGGSLTHKKLNLADIDTDGDLDIALSRQQVWIENQDSQGTFQRTHAYPPSRSFGQRFADLDADGDQDLITELRWYENVNGTGLFRDGEQFDAQPMSARNIDVGDVDGDHDLDIVAGHWYANFYADLTFDRKLLATTSDYTTTHAADLDNDGDLDAIVHYQSDLYWQENENGEAFFGTPNYIRKPDDFDCINSIIVDDVDFDGDLDIIAAIDSHLAWFENQNGRGRFDLNAGTIVESGRMAALTMADANDDGLRDLIASYGWYPKLPAGGFGERVAFPNRLTPNVLMAVDLDLDGDQDVIGSGDVGTFWLENRASGDFQPQQPLRGESTSVDAADLDNDGDIDLVFSAWSGKIGWLERIDGEVVDFEERTLLVGDRAFVAIAHDLDDDGDTDVLSGSERGVIWFENQRRQPA